MNIVFFSDNKTFFASLANRYRSFTIVMANVRTLVRFTLYIFIIV